MTWLDEWRTARRAAWNQLWLDYSARFGAEDREAAAKWKSIGPDFTLGWLMVLTFLGAVAVFAKISSGS